MGYEVHLDPIEKAIRAALEKGDLEDGAFRQKIYRSAEAALTRSLSARAGLDEPAKDARLVHLARMVASIETEFTPVMAPIVDSEIRSGSRVSGANIGAPPPRAVEPRFETRPERDWSTTPGSGRGDSDHAAQRYGHSTDAPFKTMDDDSGKASGGLFRKLVTAFVFITILALLVMFGWTAWNSGLFGNAADDGSGPQKLSRSEDSTDLGPQQVGNGAAEDENWINVFEPKDASSVQASDGLTAELRGSGTGAYLNITNTTNKSQGEAIFEIGRGVLETLRGKKIVFNVQAKTTDGSTTQMAASCSLAGMGECQRVRFRLEGQLTENLIIMQLADAAPEASGTLTIVPDIDKTGNPVEIISIRVRVEQ